MKIKDRIVNGKKLRDFPQAPVSGIDEVCLKANAEGAVLLRNNGVLPLKKVKKQLFSDVFRQIITKVEQVRAEP